MIVARESITAQAMRDAGLHVRTWCDPAFTLTAEELPLPDGWREKQTVGLNVSPLILDHTKDKKTALNAFVALVRHILRTSENAIALIPHVTWAHDNDGRAFRYQGAVCGFEPRVFLLPDRLNAMQYKELCEAAQRAGCGADACFHRGLFDVCADAGDRLFGQGAGHCAGLVRRGGGPSAPAQELSGEAELIAAYDALMKRGNAEREQLPKTDPVVYGGAGGDAGRCVGFGERKIRHEGRRYERTRRNARAAARA